MRPSVDEYFMNMARVVSTRSTCFRRSVGCVLVDQYNRPLATGYNGVASGLPHCNHMVVDRSYVAVDGEAKPRMSEDDLYPYLCKSAKAPSGTSLEGCKAIHAEANALISCRNPEDVHRAYVTASPCEQCVRYFLNTPCQSIIFEEVYPHTESEGLWIGQGRTWVHFIRPK